MNEVGHPAGVLVTDQNEFFAGIICIEANIESEFGYLCGITKGETKSIDIGKNNESSLAYRDFSK